MIKILGAFLILFVTVSCNNSSSQDKNDKFSEWALKNSQKIETLEITDRSYIMSEGRILISGTKEVLINDSKAREIYLGEKFRL